MYCIKCGRDVKEGQVFCDSCQEVMKKYPVKPGTAIQLPGKKEAPPKKTYTKRKQPLSPEEQILRLKKRLKRLVIMWLVTLLLLAATVYPTVQFVKGLTIRLPGQNYSTIVHSETAEP